MTTIDKQYDAANPLNGSIVMNLRNLIKKESPNGHTLLTDQDLMDCYKDAQWVDEGRKVDPEFVCIAMERIAEREVG